MERVNRVLANEKFQNSKQKIEAWEKDRIFCKHDMVHFLDVARIAQILNLKEALGLPEELIYAAALLHDIGRHVQYADGTPHERASMPIAKEILIECGFDEKETDVIVKAIGNHRTAEIKENRDLNGILYRADKGSRNATGRMTKRIKLLFYEKKGGRKCR